MYEQSQVRRVNRPYQYLGFMKGDIAARLMQMSRPLGVNYPREFYSWAVASGQPWARTDATLTRSDIDASYNKYRAKQDAIAKDNAWNAFRLQMQTQSALSGVKGIAKPTVFN